MAQKVNIVLVDDIDGTDASETLTFGLDGSSYEIDLTEANATALRNALAPYLGFARKTTAAGRKGRRSTGTANGSKNNPREVREWARSAGYKVSDRGRVPADVIAAFEAAH